MAKKFRSTKRLSFALALAVATVVTDQDAFAQAIHWPKQELAIPFQLGSVGTPPELLELEVSEDSGKTWQSVGKADSKQRQFQFQTQRDGAYWFRVKSLDRSGQLIDQPGEPMQIVIDSTKPAGQLLIDLDRKGDLQAEFRIVESSLDHSSIRLEYQTELDSAWKEVTCKTEKGTQDHEWIGSASWTIPHQATQLIVRLSGRDQAGNAFEVTRMPKLPKTAMGMTGSMKFASTRQGSGQEPVGSGVAKPTLMLPKLPGPTLPGSTLPGSTLPSGLNLAPAAPKPAAPSVSNTPQMFTSTGLPVRSIESIPPTSLLGKDQDKSNVSQLPALEPPIQSQTSSKPNALHSSSKSFELDYAIVNDPGSPIASIELWGTLDQGKTWERWGVDADRESPFDIEVDTEGLFGFRMVIVGSNGLASRRPLPGDSADAWIHVDTSMPRARILSALAGKGSDAGALVIEYQAIDDHFIDRPISLYYAETMQGPWIPITQGAKNQGRFAWAGESHIPEKVFLKLQATDAAGNVGEHVLDLPVDVQSAAPRGKIQGFRPR
ncbi:MAG: hypothetical protein LW850_31835 [Planctomycetaceae bacterium]|jgi:hypothetical protein|nr:hypothetical protein [Planctomycetaceae bacterium]